MSVIDEIVEKIGDDDELLTLIKRYKEESNDDSKYKEMYFDLKKKYVERFLNGDETDTKEVEKVEEVKQTEDDEEITINDLFKEVKNNGN